MRIVLADDHELVRAGLKPFLAELGAEVAVDEHGDLDGVLAAADSADGKAPSVDLVIVDLRMPGVTGPESLGRVVKAHAPAPVVVLSASRAVDDILLAAKEGVAGYLLKTMPGPVMLAALRLVLLGERHFPAAALDAPRTVFGATAPRGTSEDGVLAPSDGGAASDGGASSGRANPLDLLSAREREILELMMEGQTNKAIARHVTLQEITVKVHLRNIYRKIGAANRTQAVRIALENGWSA